jgi:ankyrin repeat protein
MMRRIAGAVILLVISNGLAMAQSPIADAAQDGDIAAVQALIRQGADVNRPQADGATALHWAVHRDNTQLADILIAAGADVKAVNRNGITSLHMASLYGNPPMIERLVKAGADARQVGPGGETMLMLAARNGNTRAIRVLLAAGADVNAREPLRGTTALMWAAEQRHPAAVQALLAAGADVNARSAPAGLPRNYMANKVDTAVVADAQQRYAAAAAAGRTYTEQLEAELAAASDRPAAPAPAAANDDDVVLAGLVGGGSGGLTALVLAAREGDLDTVRVLLESGADVNQTTNYGWTPLLTATNNKHYRLGLFLLERGADPNIANKGGWTPLYLATDNANIENGDYPVAKPDADHVEFIKVLLDRKADPNARIKDDTLSRTIFTMQWFFESGATPFLRASQSGDTTLMKLLLSYGADPMVKTEYEDTALTLASGIGWVEGVTYERSAAENLEAVRMLLDLGLDPNAANKDGRTPLMGAALKGRNEVVQLLVDRGARLDQRDRGSRDTDKARSLLAGHTWQALDYADGLVRAGVQSAIPHPETAALIRKLMTERGMPVPPPNRVVESICIVEICKERVWD